MSHTEVIVCEPSAIVRLGLVSYAEQTPSIRVVGASSNAEIAAEVSRLSTAAVALVGGSPDELHYAIRAIMASSATTQVVAVVPDEASPHAHRARTAGALAIVTHSVSAGTLGAVVVRAARGDALAWAADESPPACQPTVPAELTGLSSRQREVLALVGAGKARKVIAHELGIGERTVKTYLTAIFAHLGVRRRTEAAMVAQRIGFAAQANARPSRHAAGEVNSPET